MSFTNSITTLDRFIVALAQNIFIKEMDFLNITAKFPSASEMV